MSTISLRHALVRIVLIAVFTISAARFGPAPEAQVFVGAPKRIAMRVTFENRVSEQGALGQINGDISSGPVSKQETPGEPESEAGVVVHVPLRLAFEDSPTLNGSPATAGGHRDQASPSDAHGFVLTGVIFEGVTVFSLSSLAEEYDNYLARRVSVQDMAAIAQAVTQKYRQAGYFLSRAIVPQQEAKTGLLKIQVYEGYVSNIDFEPRVPGAIRHYFEPLLHEKIAKLSSVDRALTKVRDLNGVSLDSPQIVPIPDNPRGYRLVVHVKRDPASASLYVDNRGTKSVGPLQAYATVSLNSVLSTGDQATLGFFTVPNRPKELLFGSGSYTTTLNHFGTNVTLTGSRFRALPGSTFAPLDLRFNSKAGGIRLSQPIRRKRDLGLWANLEFDVRDVRETEAQSLVFSDRIRALRGSISYYRRHNGGESRASIEVSHGLPILGASDPSAGALASRPGANRDFTKADLFVSRYQDIGRVFGLYLAGTAQYSPDPLLTSENFSLGGPRFGRAYDYWEVSGQSGIAGTAEFRYGRNPGLKWLNFYQLYAFYDAGAVWNDTPSSGTQRDSLSSAGAGLRLTLFKKISLNYELAVPLSRIPSARTNRAPRHFFSFTAQF